jgi:hydroxymethylpyrimidine pyrophosphatase-like HAD family hydrolase
VHASRLAGQLCDPKPQPGWCQRLVVIDVDGVLDRQVFGFPSTTAAGIRAISLLHAHGWPVAINTARSVAEVKEYCAAYRMAGGIAEYGAYMWDAVSGRERVLVCAESCRQLAELADQLRRVPGVFLNDDYKYSIRAFTYQNGVSVALPLLMVQSLISELKLDRLIVHQTFLDSAVVAKETNKGRGLLELLAFADRHGANVVAIGDSEPDLPMFRVVKRSYAPAQILCKHAARLLGCQIVSDKYQLGFLNAARRIVHEGGGRCTKCAENDRLLTGSTDLFTQLFQLADRAKIPELLKALLNPKAIASLRQ